MLLLLMFAFFGCFLFCVALYVFACGGGVHSHARVPLVWLWVVVSEISMEEMSGFYGGNVL